MSAGQDKKTGEAKHSFPREASRAVYSRPQLKNFGHVRHLTAGGSGIPTEAVMGGPWMSAMP